LRSSKEEFRWSEPEFFVKGGVGEVGEPSAAGLDSSGFAGAFFLEGWKEGEELRKRKI